MSSSLEYHESVRHSISASVAFLSLLVLAFISSAPAQISGVTSPPLVGRSVNPPTNTTSLAPQGYPPNYRFPLSTPLAPHFGDGHRDGHRHRRHHFEYPPALAYAVPVPYAVDIGAADDDVDPNADDSDPDYQGGPTVFDRRGSGADSYIPPMRNVSAPPSEGAAASVADPGPPQEPTLLVFRDGRKLEVGNYAILGQTLFDLTPGHARKIALADLDIEATRQQNDDRGITFQLPSSQAN